jgi:hypothetical protein
VDGKFPGDLSLGFVFTQRGQRHLRFEFRAVLASFRSVFFCHLSARFLYLATGRIFGEHFSHHLRALCQRPRALPSGLCFAQAGSRRSARIIKLANERIDQRRRAPEREADALGYATLQRTRYLLLRGSENVPEDKRDQLREALRFNEPLSTASDLQGELRALRCCGTREAMRRWLDR